MWCQWNQNQTETQLSTSNTKWLQTLSLLSLMFSLPNCWLNTSATGVVMIGTSKCTAPENVQKVITKIIQQVRGDTDGQTESAKDREECLAKINIVEIPYTTIDCELPEGLVGPSSTATIKVKNLSCDALMDFAPCSYTAHFPDSNLGISRFRLPLQRLRLFSKRVALSVKYTPWEYGLCVNKSRLKLSFLCQSQRMKLDGPLEHALTITH